MTPEAWEKEKERADRLHLWGSGLLLLVLLGLLLLFTGLARGWIGAGHGG